MVSRVTLLVLALSACTSARTTDDSALTATAQTSGTNALLIAVSPVNDNVVWASGSLGTWLRTTDGGTTWQTGRVPGADSLQFRDVHAVDANTAYLLSIGNGDQSRIYKTTDAGQTWVLQFRNTEQQAFYDCFDFWDARRGIVIGDAVGEQMRMLITEDGGAHWTGIPADRLPRAQAGEGSFAASGTCLITKPGGHAWAVASNPQRGRLLHTADYGRTWAVDTLLITTHEGSGPQSVSFRDNQRGVVLGGGYPAKPTDTLAVLTRDGGRTWTPRTRPPLPRGFWGGVFVPGTNVIVGVGPDGSVYSRDEGASWMQIDTFNYWSVGFASRRAGWAVGARGRITRLTF